MPEDKTITLEGVKAEVTQALSELKKQWKGHYEELKSDGANTGEMLEGVKTKIDNAVRRIEEAEAVMARPGFVNGAEQGEIKSIGQIVSEDVVLRENFSDGGSATRFRGKLNMPVENLSVEGLKSAGSFFPYDLSMVSALVPELKTTITSTAVGSSTAGILTPQRVPGIVKPPQPRLRVRDLIPRLPTTSNAIEYVQENAFTNAALTSPQTETASKAESALTFTITSRNVRTLAHWIPATKQIISDFPALQGYINIRLLDGLKDEEDDQILRGDGTGMNLTGFASDSTAYVDGTYDKTGDTILDKLVRMMTQLEASNYQASGIVLHPTDWRTMQTIKLDQGGGAGTGAYLLGGPQGVTPPLAWGLPVATTTRMTADTAFVGDFARYVVLWDRMQASVELSTEHASFFIRNMVAILAEERVCLTVHDTGAIIYESGLA